MFPSQLYLVSWTKTKWAIKEIRLLGKQQRILFIVM
jgi:hypothetical protein